MKTTYLKKQHERALLYLECIDRVMRMILILQDEQRKIELKATPAHSLYNARDYDKPIVEKKEFSIWLMTRYEKVMDNIGSHSYSRETSQTI